MSDAPGRTYDFGPFHVDAARRLLEREGRPVRLTAKAFDILLLLLEERGRLVGKDELMRRIWPDAVVEENNLTVQISSLRKVLGPDAIATVAGRGYRFTLPLLDDDAPASPGEPSSPRERPVIAVLAFDNLSNEPEMQFFSDGVSEEILHAIARATRSISLTE